MQRCAAYLVLVFAITQIIQCSSPEFPDSISQEGTGLSLRITRENDRFHIRLKGTTELKGRGPGTYVVFVAQEDIQNAITLAGEITDQDEITVSGEYCDAPNQGSVLDKLTIAIEVAYMVTMGTLSIEILTFPYKLVGVQPITSTSQLPGIALALGNKYVKAVGEANMKSEPFRKLLAKMSDGRPGILLVSGMAYCIDMRTSAPINNVCIDVVLPYKRSELLPRGVDMLNAIIAHLKKNGISDESVSASLSAESCNKAETYKENKRILGYWKGSFNQYNYGTYPMIMNIPRLVDNEFSGALVWPTLRNSMTTCEGQIDGDILIWTELKLLRGSQIVLNGTYQAEFKGEDKIEGQWYWPKSKKKGGEFTLTRR